MAIKKIALTESLIERENLIPIETIAGSDEITQRFKRLTDESRELQAKAGFTGSPLSPRVDDFLYVHCIMMHAAEASLINQDTGEYFKNKQGEPVAGRFVDIKDKKGRDSVVWESPDHVLPYKNCNGDIFPEEDLKKAYKLWVGKPLCKDHISSSVDGIRGIIVDTHYDVKFKRVHALFALDRKNYAELARKVEAGYATSVSMGTAVGKSICSDCGNVATVESEYCPCVRNRTCHGEVNRDLNPIELSLVVTGADPKAKVMTVIASYKQQLEDMAAGNTDVSGLSSIKSQIDIIEAGLQPVRATKSEEQAVREIVSELGVFKDRTVSPENRQLGERFLRKTLSEAGKSLGTLSDDNRRSVLEAAQSAGIDLEEKNSLLSQRLQSLLKTDKETIQDVQPGLVSKERGSKTELVDSNGYGLATPAIGETGIAPSMSQAISSLYIDGARTGMSNLNIAQKIANLKNQIADIENQLVEEKIMTFADLRKSVLERKAYWNGTEEPTPGKPQYAPMGDSDKIRDKEDRQMLQDGKMGGMDGMVPGDEEKKSAIQRTAEFEARKLQRQAWLKEAAEKQLIQTKQGPRVFDPSKKDFEAKDGKVAAKKKKDDDEDEEDDKKKSKKDSKSDKDDEDEDKKDSKSDKKDSKDKKDKDDKPEAGKKGVNPFKKDKDGKDDKKKKEAYFQGTEEPTPGKAQYAPMGDSDKIREKDDRQMLQTGKIGMDGMIQGDEEVKRTMQRMANLSARFFKSAKAQDSRWQFLAGGKELFSVSAGQAYGDSLNAKPAQSSLTLGEFFHSKDYGRQVIASLKEVGLTATAQEIGVKVAADMPPPPAPDAGSAPPDAGHDLGADKGKEKSADEKVKDLKPLIMKLEETLAEIQDITGSKATPEEENLQDVSVDAGGPVPPPPGPDGAKVARVSDKDMLSAFAAVNDACQELCLIANSNRRDAQSISLAAQAVDDAVAIDREARFKISAYAAQKKSAFLAKRAANRQALVARAMEQDVLDSGEVQEVENMVHHHEKDMHDHLDTKPLTEGELMHDLKDDDDTLVDGAPVAAEGESLALDQDCGDSTQPMMVDDGMITKTVEARKAWRQNIVKSAGEYLDLLEKERKGGGHTLENLDVKVSNDGAKVETIIETHNKMMDVATKPMAKVKAAAEKLDQTIKAGLIAASKLEGLVAAGHVDPEAAKYWKQYYGQVEDGKEFANGLVSEFKGTKKAGLDTEALETRIRRAYALGAQAQKKGIVLQTQAALEQYVDTLKVMPEDAFNAIKAHVELYRVPAGLVSAPMVGLHERRAGIDENGLVVTASVSDAPTFDNLSKLFG